MPFLMKIRKLYIQEYREKLGGKKACSLLVWKTQSKNIFKIHIKIISMNNFSLQTVSEAFREANIAAYAGKPINM